MASFAPTAQFPAYVFVNRSLGILEALEIVGIAHIHLKSSNGSSLESNHINCRPYHKQEKS